MRFFLYLQKSSACILFQVHVILLVIFIHHLRSELALLQIVRIKISDVFIELDKFQQILAENASCGEGHQNLILEVIER